MTKKIISIIAAAAVMFSVNAQSARVEGLADVSTIDDPSIVTGYPSSIMDTKDIFQATFNSSDVVNEIFAIKSIGDALALGFYWDQDKMVSNFYSLASNALSSSDYENLSSRSQRVPHILLGLELGDIKLGADLFFENARYKYQLETTSFDPNGTDQDYFEKGRVSNPGFILGAALEVGDMDLSIDAGLSFPNVKIELWDATEEENYIARDSDKGLFFTLEAILGLELFDLDWTVGAGIDYETQKFVTLANADNNTDEVFHTKSSVLDVNILLGMDKELSNNLILGLEDNFTISSDITTPDEVDAGNPETKDITLTHDLSFGIEKLLTNLKRFDNLALRFGMNYPIVTTIDKSEGEGQDSTTMLDLYKEKSKDGTEWGPFEAVIGFGVAKGRFAFDVFMNSDMFNPSNWNYGVLSGAPVAGASVTFDFNKKSSSKRAAAPAGSYSAPVAAEPASSFESTPAKESSTETEASSDSFDF